MKVKLSLSASDDYELSEADKKSLNYLKESNPMIRGKAINNKSSPFILNKIMDLSDAENSFLKIEAIKHKNATREIIEKGFNSNNEEVLITALEFGKDYVTSEILESIYNRVDLTDVSIYGPSKELFNFLVLSPISPASIQIDAIKKNSFIAEKLLNSPNVSYKTLSFILDNLNSFNQLPLITVSYATDALKHKNANLFVFKSALTSDNKEVVSLGKKYLFEYLDRLPSAQNRT